MKSIIFIAPPAAGKGTHSTLVEEKYGIPHASTGDLLRSAENANDDRAKLISELIEQGKLVPDEIVLELLKERLAQEDCKNGYILDGFPRNVSQAEAYDKILSEINMPLGNVILLELDKEIAKKRITGRLTCPKCNAIYNSEAEELKPQVDGYCDNCHVELQHRSDDNAETYDVRYDTYMRETAPLIDYYDAKGVLFRIDSSVGKERTFKEIEKIIGE